MTPGEAGKGGAAVVIMGRWVVRPATPSARCRIPLSGFELKAVAIPHFQEILFFRAPGVPLEELAATLKASLSRALVEFFLLAGRFHTDTAGRVTVDCSDAGVDLVLASTDMEMAELGEALEPSPFFSSLIPQSALPPVSPLLPPLSVQVTQFGCGGIAIGGAMSHVIADGTAMCHFITSWAELARGEEMSVRAVHERFGLPKQPAAAPTLSLSLNWDFVPVPLKQHRVLVSPAQLARLKAEATQDGKLPFSSFQALCAHCWIHVTRARRLRPHQEVRYYLSVDCRPRVRPSLSPGYVGSAVLTEYASCTAGEVVSEGFSWVTNLLHRAVKGMDDTRIREKLEQDEAAGYPNLLHGFVPGIHLGSACSPKFPVYDIDFGWGKPVAVRNGQHVEYLDGVLWCEPSPHRGGVHISMTLYPETIARLRADPDFLPLP